MKSDTRDYGKTDQIKVRGVVAAPNRDGESGGSKQGVTFFLKKRIRFPCQIREKVAKAYRASATTAEGGKKRPPSESRFHVKMHVK